jgi:hypothetical protein
MTWLWHDTNKAHYVNYVVLNCPTASCLCNMTYLNLPKLLKDLENENN